MDPVTIGALIGAGSSMIGGAMGSKSAKDAAKMGRNASNRELGYMTDAAAKADRYSAPYREAGYTALDALMSMTGLGGGAPSTPGSYKGYSEDEFAEYGGADPAKQPWLESGMTPKEYYWDQRRNNQKAFHSAYSKKERRAMRSGNPDAIRQWFDPTYGLAYGGPAMSGQTYNINEIGPENYYSGGAITRTSQPRTIRPSTQGYVRPYGRAIGGQVGPGFMVPPTSGGYNDAIPNGGSLPPATQTPAPTGGVPQENPGGVEGGYNFMTDPGYQFRQDEGMRALERGAAARGGLLSGGFGRKAIRYGQDYASQEYQNVYNRIANIAGLGQVSSGQGAQNALYGGQGMAGAAGNAGAYGAMGAMGSGNAWASAFNQAAQLPWGDVKWPWGGGTSGGGGGVGIQREPGSAGSFMGG